MKALLIVMLMWEGGAAAVTPMPTMEGCEAAAQKLEKKGRENGFRKGVFSAVCVENR